MRIRIDWIRSRWNQFRAFSVAHDMLSIRCSRIESSIAGSGFAEIMKNGTISMIF